MGASGCVGAPLIVRLLRSSSGAASSGSAVKTGTHRCGSSSDASENVTVATFSATSYILIIDAE